MSAKNIVLHLPAILKHADYFAGREQAFAHLRQSVEKGKVKRSINAYDIASFRIHRIAANKASNFLLAVIYFAEREKVFLADTEGKLAHGVAKNTGEIRINVL